MATPSKVSGNKYPFLAIVKWEQTDDKAMVKRLYESQAPKPNSKKSSTDSESIPWNEIDSYYLIGARTVILVGNAKSPLDIQKISSFFIFNSSIKIEIYNVIASKALMEVDQIKQLK